MSENKPTIFISHATWRENSRKKTRKILEKLSDLLEADDWDVFVDRKKLREGEKWRPVIIHALSTASAGVILFDKVAIKDSNWVKVEALIMCYRKAIDPSFQLIPVLLDDLEPGNDCFNIFSPLQLFEIGCLRNKGEQTVELCERIRKAVKIKNAKRSEINSWISTFEDWLYEVLGKHELKEHILRELWHSLQTLIEDAGNENPYAYQEEILRRAITQLLHHWGPSETLNVFNRIKYYKQSGIDKTKLETIEELIRVKWVENRWIEIFFNSTRKDRDKLLFVLNKPMDDLKLFKHVESFLKRLNYERQPDQKFKAFTLVEAAGFTEEDIQYHIESQIGDYLGSVYPIDSKHHENHINDCLAESDTLYLFYIPPPLAKKNVLAKIKSRYPRMLILIDANLTEQQNQLEDLEIKFLKPFLTIEKINELGKVLSKL